MFGSIIGGKKVTIVLSSEDMCAYVLRVVCSQIVFAF